MSSTPLIPATTDPPAVVVPRALSPSQLDQLIHVCLNRDFLTSHVPFPGPDHRPALAMSWRRVTTVPGGGDGSTMASWQRLLTALHSSAPRLVFVLTRRGGTTSLQIGVGSLDEAIGELGAARLLERAAAAVIPQLRLESTDVRGETRSAIIRALRQLPAACVITGVPRVVTAENRQRNDPIERIGALAQLATGFSEVPKDTPDYAVVIVADAVTDQAVGDVLGRFRRLGTSVHELVQQSTQSSTTTGTNQYRLPEPYSFVLSLLPLPLWSWFATNFPSESDSQSLTVSTEGCDYVARDCERLIERHLQRLGDGRSLGFWNTSIHVFADGAESLQTVAGMIRGAIAGDGTEVEPIRIIPIPGGSRATEWMLTFEHVPLPRAERRSQWHPLGELYQYASTPINTNELVTLSQPPSEDVPGLRADLRTGRFSLNSPATARDRTGIRLGHVLGPGNRHHGPYVLGRDSLVRHVMIGGATGIGKSTGTRALTGAISAAGCPYLVIEPVKDDWARWAVAHNRTARPPERIAVYMPGVETLDGVPVEPLFLNPFEPPGTPGYRPNMVHRLQRVSELLNTCLPMAESLPILLEAAVLRLGDDHFGDRFTIGEWCTDYPRLETLKDHVRYYLREHGGSGYYDQSVKDNLHAALDVRIESLTRGIRGAILNASGSTPWAALFERPAVVNLSRTGDSGTRSLLMSLLLIALWDWRLCRYESDQEYRDRAGANALCHLAIIEEAHTVLRAPKEARAELGDPQAAIARMFEDMLAEIRQLGQGLVLVDQGVSDLIPGALKNTGTKIAYRLQHSADREAMAASMGLDRQQARDIGLLDRGEAIVATDLDPNPCRVSIGQLS